MSDHNHERFLESLKEAQEEYQPPKLYTANPTLAEQWRKDSPGIEVVLTPRQIPTGLEKYDKQDSAKGTTS